MSSAASALQSIADEPNPERRARLEAAAQTLARVLGARPRFRRIQIHALEKGMPGRIVAEGTLRGQRCFVKLLIGHHAEAAINEMQAELRYAEGNMTPEGCLRVARVLDAAPRLGLIVLEAAPGVRLDDAVEAAEPEGRRALNRRSGEWLAWYCAPRRETRAFDAARFRAEHAVRSRPPAYVGEIAPEDRKRIEALADYIDRRARKLAGVRVSIAASHGDFLARNAHVSGEVMTAYDIEGLRRVPVTSDAARFLVHQQMRQGFPSDDLTCGLSSEDWTAFFESGVVETGEEQAVMPLFVAQQMQIELPGMAFRPNWQRRLRRSIDAFLRCPRALSVWLAQFALILPPVV